VRADKELFVRDLIVLDGVDTDFVESYALTGGPPDSRNEPTAPLSALCVTHSYGCG